MPIPETFRGLSPDLPIEIYTRSLPHWRQEGATYFVTFRLLDSIPESVLRDQRAEARQLYRDRGIEPETLLDGTHPASKDLLALQQRHTRALENILDQGRGLVVLRDFPARDPVIEALDYHAESTCELYTYVIMPNHVHALLRPLSHKKLEKILQSIKAYSSKRISDAGQLWQNESYDTIIRDEDHFLRALDYIQANPKKANLRLGEFHLAEL